MRLEPGYNVSPHVRLVRLLRKGGMGSVWVADHLALKSQVAVKFMSAALAQDEAMVTRFTREAAFAARIRSPHVVQIHDHGLTEDGIPYIVMELLEGEDLAEYVKRVGSMPLDDVARMVGQLSRALAKAHLLGIVHRDIKLNNVFLVDTDGDIFAKLLDFGIAKQQGNGEGSDVTTTGAMVGTLVYMSPEQLHNAKQVDYRTDLWSLAVVAYRSLTGNLPFRDEDGIGALLTAVSSGSFVLPGEVRPDVPPELDAWFQKALKRNPDERFASAREMAEAFDRAIGREPTAAPVSRSSIARDVPLETEERSGVTQSEAGTAAGVTHAQTVASSTDARPGRSRGITRIVMGLIAIGAAIAVAAALLYRGGFADVYPGPDRVGGEPAPAGAIAPGVTAAPTVVPSPSAEPPESSAPPAPTVAAAAGASAVASAGVIVASTSSAAPPASASAKAGGIRGTKKPGGTAKEKDYGF